MTVFSPHLRLGDLLPTALAPMIWGSTYLVSTEWLAGFPPLLVALLRALPAGLLLLLIVRRLPSGPWLGRVLILGALNFSIFWTLLFVAAYRLPGGVAATLGALQPLLVILLASVWLGQRIRAQAVVAALIGLGGVALLVLTPEAALDPLGLAAALGGAVSMACGTVLTRRWQPPVSLLTLTAWQLTAGGLLLIPPALLFAPLPPTLTPTNLIGLGWLGLVGGALTYWLWFRGIARLEAAVVSSLGFLSPVTAVLLGWIGLGQSLTPFQLAGVVLVIGGIWLGQRPPARPSSDRAA
ncbi:EamA family transporter [Phaeospirillum tilakii]|uniref:EamA family transporter n=1 Tax=Phaeospirillum tilakii TaxID=741673 RepID=A0ABW5CCM9_9PROT